MLFVRCHSVVILCLLSLVVPLELWGLCRQMAGNYSGLVRAESSALASNASEGGIEITLAASGKFTGLLRIAGARMSFVGQVDETGHARFGVAQAESLLLVQSPHFGGLLSWSVDLNPESAPKVTGTLRRLTREGAEPLAVLQAVRHAFDGKSPGTSALAAYYTWHLPPAPQTNGLQLAQFPQGHSVGSLKVSKNGSASLAGTLADGSKITAGAALGADMEWPLFVSLEKGTGSLNGWLKVDHTQPDTDVSAQVVHWFKPARPTAAHYPFGWPEGLTLSLAGARFRTPAGESILPDLSDVIGSNAWLEFTDGGLTKPVPKELNISIRNQVRLVPATGADYTLNLSAETGVFSGKWTQAAGAQPSYTGVILQKGMNRRGYGHFLSVVTSAASTSGQGGAVTLETKFPPRQTLVIAEFMANNETTLADEDGDFSDWIEIYNPGSESVDLVGWHLTDSAREMDRWAFPAVTIEPRQLLLVWASGKDRTDPLLPLHTNFSLSASGEYLALVRPDGMTVEHEFSPLYPAQANDESYGLNLIGRSIVTAGATVKYRVPTNDALGLRWTQRDFEDGGWASGKTGIGFGVGVPGFTLRQVAAHPDFGGVDSIATCEALLALPKDHPNILSEATAIVPRINHLGDGDDGNYGANLELPNGVAEPYALKATGVITIPAAGDYVFGLNSDDGGRIKIDGAAVMIDDSNHGPEDHLSAPVRLTAGSHTVEIIMWEGGGGDCVEFFAKAGRDTTWDADFKLVGSPDGLAVVTTPLGSTVSPLALVKTNVKTNVRAAMIGKQTSCQVRLPFTVNAASTLSSLTLQMRYNDGFVAYLNGTEVVRRNAPADIGFQSTATAGRTLIQTLEAEEIDLSAHLPLLVTGRNVLAIHGMNLSRDDGSFLLQPELSITAGLAANTAFFRPQDGISTATPGLRNSRPADAGDVAPLVFSHPHGFYESAFSLKLSTETAGASIRYTLDGSTPTATRGHLYSGPVRIAKTSIVRAVAYRSGFKPAPLVTQSYLFLNDIIRQSTTGQRPAPGWPMGKVNGQVADYGMDPVIVNHRNPLIGGVDKVKSALRAIPTLSIVTDLPNLFNRDSGIWVNPYNRGSAWERPASIELIGDSGPNGGFEINGGLRIRGGFSRSDMNPKHSLRLFFRGEYGASKLQYPLFGDEGGSSFDKIDLRTAQNYSWSFMGDSSNTFLREETSRQLQGAMGQPYTRSRDYHLYINGQYWGLYGTIERAEASFAETYIGGNKEDYDTVKVELDQDYITGVTDGNLDAWEQLRLKARAHAAQPTNANYFALSGKAADGVTPTADPVLLEVDNLIDYMLLTFWTGNLDGATSAFFGDARANNWYAVRNRLGTHGGFRFLAHDFEHSFLSTDDDRTGPFESADPTNPETYNPMFIHHDLRPNAEYRMLWADHVQRHLFADGVLTPTSLQSRMRARQGLLDKVIIAESARWGDAQTGRLRPFNRLDWQEAVRYVVEDYVPVRGDFVLAQLREDGLYPSYDAPTLSHLGGSVTLGEEIIITGQGGTVYYTLDGSDPRLVGGALSPTAQPYTAGALFLNHPGPLTLKVRALREGEWSALVQANYAVQPVADLTVALAPQGSFATSGTASYAVTVMNRGSVPTAGLVTVTLSLPPGLSAASATGLGWTVVQAVDETVTARRFDALAPAASFPVLNVAVRIAATAPGEAVTQANVSGGGELALTNNTASHTTAIQATGASQIFFSAAQYEALEENYEAVITLRRTGDRSSEATCRVRSRDGSARAPGDYGKVDEYITFAPGESEHVLFVGVSNDDRDEPHERFSLRLSEVTGAASLGLPAVASVRLLEADRSIPTVVLNTPSAAARVVASTVTLRGTASDDKGLGRVEVAVNGAAYAPVALELRDDERQGSFQLAIPAVAGENSVRVRAVDARGLISNEVLRRFTHAPLKPLQLTLLPSFAGTVSLSPEADLSSLEVGRRYTLRAKARPGFLWDRWISDGQSHAAPDYTFTMREGLVITASFATSPFAASNTGTYIAHIRHAATATPQHDRHGQLTLTLTPDGAFSGSLRLGQTRHSLRGDFHPDGSARFGPGRETSLALPRPALTDLRLSLQLDPEAHQLTGSLAETGRTGLSPWSEISGARRNPRLPADSVLLQGRGRYRLTQQLTAPPAGTPGFPAAVPSLWTGQLSRAGDFTLAGRLADGSAFTAAAVLNADLTMSLHVPLKTALGTSLSAVLLWTQTPSDRLRTTAPSLWFRPLTPHPEVPYGWPEGLEFSLREAD